MTVKINSVFQGEYLLSIRPHSITADDAHMDFGVEEFFKSYETAMKAVNFWDKVFTNVGWNPNYYTDSQWWLVDSSYESESGSLVSIHLETIDQEEVDTWRETGEWIYK